MKIKQLAVLGLLAASVSGCRKDFHAPVSENLDQDSLLRVFQNSKIPTNPIVNLSSNPNFNNINALKSSGVVRDSIWGNMLGKTYFVESNNFMVSDETQEVIYPGAILDSKAITSRYEFNTFPPRTVEPLPIRASLSIPGSAVSGVIDFPSIGTTRDFIGQIVARQGNIQQINSFSYASSEFKDYNELKYTFGANVDIAKIANVALTGSSTKIKNKVGIIAKFVQENFTADVSLPKKTELISVSDADALQAEYAPTYISSVTYGRMGIFMAETDASYEDFNLALKAGVNIGVVKADAHVTAAQKEILDKAKITVYMKFGSGPATVKTANGYKEFKEAILEGANVKADSYGGPISFRMRNLKDFSLFKTIFKVDVNN